MQSSPVEVLELLNNLSVGLRNPLVGLKQVLSILLVEQQPARNSLLGEQQLARNSLLGEQQLARNSLLVGLGLSNLVEGQKPARE